MDRARNDRERCAYRSPTGRRCRNKATMSWNMCHAHCDFSSTYARAAEIVSNRDRLDTAEGVHRMLARVARALAAGQIRSRDAATLIYAGQTMLQSLNHVHEERHRIFFASEEDAWRMKALADSYHDELNCEDAEEDAEETDGEQPEGDASEEEVQVEQAKRKSN